MSTKTKELEINYNNAKRKARIYYADNQFGIRIRRIMSLDGLSLLSVNNKENDRIKQELRTL